MCYSVKARHSLTYFRTDFNAELNADASLRLFQTRALGERVSISPRLESELVDHCPGLRPIVDDWRKSQIRKLTEQLEQQRARLQKAKIASEGALSPISKRVASELRISSQKIRDIEAALERYQPVGLNTAVAASSSQLDERIFPQQAALVLVAGSSGVLETVPMRYQMRPSTKTAAFDREFSGTYNARSESLMTVGWWKSSLSTRKGVLVATHFYENVQHQVDQPGASRNRVVEFAAEGQGVMYFPVLWDFWSVQSQTSQTLPGFFSFALITREPNVEVMAVGHDRTPVTLAREQLEQWLMPSSEKATVELLAAGSRPIYRPQFLDP